MAAEPDVPIEWDDLTGEYHLTWGNENALGNMIFYHCPFCGGRMPASRREMLFAEVTEAENRRLFRLCSGCETLDAVIEAFGPPDHDLPNGAYTITPEKDGKPSRTVAARELIYERLSETADVRFSDWGRSPIHVAVEGKYIGPDPK
jgi:hypothetical protein